MSVVSYIILYVFFIGLSFYFSGMEVSLFCLRKIPKKTKKTEVYLTKYEQYFDHYFTLCLFGNILAGVVVSHITFFLCYEWFGKESTGTWIEGVFCVVTVGILFYMGEIIPKILVRRSIMRFLRNTQYLLRFFSILFTPAIVTIQIFSKLFFPKLGNLQGERVCVVSRKDLKHCFEEELEVGGKEWSRHPRFFSLSTVLLNIKASEVMVPLADFQSFDEDLSIEKVIQLLRTKGDIREVDYIVLYKNRVDAISGYVSIIDLLEKEGKMRETEKIKSVSKKIVYFPKTNTLESVLQQFLKQKKEKISVLVDEYGGCCGIVDRSSIIRKIFGISYKSMVGVLQEGGNRQREMIKKIEPFLYEVDTLFDIDDLNKYLEISLPKKGEYKTLAGLINAHCERILPQGSKFEIEGIQCTVMTATVTSVDRVLLELPRGRNV